MWPAAAIGQHDVVTDFYRLTYRGRARRLRAVAVTALEQYDLQVERMALLSNETNAVFRVVDVEGHSHVLRVGRGGHIGHSLDQVRSETQWLRALAADTDLRIPTPITNRHGSSVTRVELDGVPHIRNCVLFTWLPGRLLDEDLTGANLEAYGALAARLHQHAAGFHPPPGFSIIRYDRVFPFDQPVVLFDERQARFVSSDHREVFATAVEQVQAVIDELRGVEPMRVLHGDLHRWNILIHRGQIAVLDFEDLIWGWPVQDLAIALYYLHGLDEYRDLRRAFRAGYETVLPWPDRSGAEIDAFIAGRALVLANDVELFEEPEFQEEGPGWMDVFANRIRSILDA